MLELLLWLRAFAGLPELGWSSQGAYRVGIGELGEGRAAELLWD